MMEALAWLIIVALLFALPAFLLMKALSLFGAAMAIAGSSYGMPSISSNERHPAPHPTKRSHARRANAAHGGADQEKRSFLAASNREASRLQREREQDRLVRQFVESLSGPDRAFAEKAGIATPLADREPFTTAPDADAEEGHEVSEMANGEYGTQNGRHALQPSAHPIIDMIEPAGAVAIEDLTPGEVAEAHDAFGRGLTWVHEASHLVKKGRRLAAFCVLVRPDLGCPVTETLPPDFRAELRHRLDCDRALLGLVFGRVFTWCREAASLSALGLRGDIIAYVIRPALLDAATNAQIGTPTNSTRQAINKLVGDFRDTFAGIRARTMRGEDTRTHCRAAQLINAA